MFPDFLVGVLMAFIGLLFVWIVTFCIIFFIGILPIVIGTIIHKFTKYKKIGMGLRIIGYTILIPTVVITLIMFFVIKR